MNHTQKTEVALKFLDKCIEDFYKSVHDKDRRNIGTKLKQHLIDALNELDVGPYAAPPSSPLQKK